MNLEYTYADHSHGAGRRPGAEYRCLVNCTVRQECPRELGLIVEINSVSLESVVLYDLESATSGAEVALNESYRVATERELRRWLNNDEGFSEAAIAAWEETIRVRIAS